MCLHKTSPWKCERRKEIIKVSAVPFLVSREPLLDLGECCWNKFNAFLCNEQICVFVSPTMMSSYESLEFIFASLSCVDWRDMHPLCTQNISSVRHRYTRSIRAEENQNRTVWEQWKFYCGVAHPSNHFLSAQCTHRRFFSTTLISCTTIACFDFGTL